MNKPGSVNASAGATGSAATDRQWIQEMCELVEHKLPENYSFVVFGFPHLASDRCYYASNATRESAIAALKEWLKHAEKDYLTHQK